MKKTSFEEPPKWADRFLSWFCKKELVEHIQGDLYEIFQDNLETYSLKKAKWKYRFAVLSLFRPGIVRKLELPSIISRAMFKNYFKIAGRQMLKHKLFTLLNVVGLATSMSVCLLIIMILEDQFSYDHFHTNKDRIVRVVSDRMNLEDGGRPLILSNATSPLPFSKELKENYPWVEKSINILPTRGSIVKWQETSRPYTGIWADPGMHEVFDFGWIEGDIKTALQEPNSVVLTQKVADEYLKMSNPIGQTLDIANWGTFKVTGLMPNHPERTHFRFDFIMSNSTIPGLVEQDLFADVLNDWDNIYAGYNYILLAENTKLDEVHAAVQKIEDEKNQSNKVYQFKFAAQPLLDITPGTIRNNNMGPSIPPFFYYFLITLSLLIMLTACFNYTNLSIARSLKRAREIGIRKVSGAKRRQIVTQFLIESVLLSIIAVLFAIFLMEFIVPAFYRLDPEISNVMHLKKSGFLFLLFFIFSLLVGLIAGLIPAMHLSSFQPIQALQKLSNVKLFARVGLRKVLIVTQFTLSILFVLGTVIILDQQRLTLSQDMGFSTENIVNVRLDEIDFDLVKKEFENVKGVKSVAGSVIVPGLGRDMMEDIKTFNDSDSVQLSYNYVTANYLNDMSLTLKAGTGFEEASDKVESIILNEVAVERLGYTNLEEVLGQVIKFPNFENGERSTDLLTVIGVVENFNYRRVYEPIGSYGLRYAGDEPLETAVVTITEGDYSTTIAGLQTVWSKVNPKADLAYTFYDEDISLAYTEFNIISKILGFVALIAIVIACMGLLGMVIYTIEGKQKEIGIRKVLGASVGGLTWKLSKGFLILIVIAVIVATPVAIVLGNMWLDGFTLRTSIGGRQIIPAIGLVLVLGLSVVVSQTFWAARSNPVDRLATD